MAKDIKNQLSTAVEDAPKSLLDKRLLMLCATWVMFAKEFLLPAASTRGRKIESAKVWPFLEKVQQQEAVIQNQLNWVNNLPENTDTWKKLTDAYHQLKFSKREITRTMNLGKITGDKHLFQAINAQKQSLEETLSNLKQTIENLEKKLYNPLIYRN